MNRLQSELHRLYALPGRNRPGQDLETPDLVGPDGQVRSMVLALARPAEWQALARVWHGVQADLELPAPAIAVAGEDGIQLWFSLAEPLPAAQAAHWLEALRLCYLGDVERHRVGLLPAVEALAPPQIRHAALVPATLSSPDRWSAFVAPDLAPMFVDEPWLDMPPNPEGQADLLARLGSIAPPDFQRALQRLQPVVEPAAAAPVAAVPRQPPTSAHPDARRFLLSVMNDETVELALRIEAAKALLPYADAVPGPQPSGTVGT